MKINVCYLVLSDGIGGAEQVAKKIIQNINRDEVEPYLITNDEILEFFSDSLQTNNILSIGKLFNFDNFIQTKSISVLDSRLGIRQLIIRSRLKKVLNFICLKRIDTIHSHLMYDLYLSTLIKRAVPKIKCIYTVHAFLNLKDKQNYYYVFNHKKFLSLLRCMDIVTTISPLINDYILGQFSDINCLNKYISNGLDFEQISHANENPELKNGRKFSIAYLGGGKYVKGGDILIQALNQIVDSGFVGNLEVSILGPIDENSNFARDVARLSRRLAITLIGFVPAPRHLDFIKSANVIVMPSRTEGFPMLVLEAFALNKAIIGSNIPIFRRLLHSEALFNLDSQSLVDVLKKCWTTNLIEELEEFSSNQNVRSWSSIVNEYRDLY